MCFEYNCSPKDMNRLCKKYNVPNFYTELLCAWSIVKYVDSCKVINILNEVMWNSSNIKFQNKMLMYTKWQTSGIIKINHIIDHNGQWKDPVVLNSHIGLQHNMFNFEFLKLKRAFPQQWLQFLRSTDSHKESPLSDSTLIQVSTGDLVNVNKTNAKIFYLFLTRRKQLMPPVIHYWNYVLKLGTEIDWKKIMLFKFGKMFENKVKQFNFKLLHRIIPSKDNLYRWKISDEDLCHRCNVKETTQHILFYCKQANTFWKIVTNLIFNIFKIQIDMNEQILIIGYYIGNMKFTTINILLILAEYVIYKNYFNKTYLNKRVNTNTFTLFKEFKTCVKNYFQCKFKQRNLNQKEVEKILEMA